MTQSCLQVFNRIVDGTTIYFDGPDHAVFNVNGNLLFTHDFFQDFLHTACKGKLTLSGYWKGKVSSWNQIRDSIENPSPQLTAVFELINRPGMVNVFLDAVFEYLALMDFEYEKAFSCQCSELYGVDPAQYAEHVYLIYDNACKVLQSSMLRLPTISKHYSFIIDAFHYKGHNNCSPFYCHKIIQAVRRINAEVNEQKNRLIRNMETSVAFMGQIRALVYMR